MPFCSNCGQKLNEGAKFCSACGSSIDNNHSNEQRKTKFEGEVYKCPQCGEVLDAFQTLCPSCGHEIRGASAALSVREFASQLAAATSDSQKILIIRSFPVPNTKEDIFEFMILASTNIDGEQQKAVYDAWLVKFEQCYKKAQLIVLDAKDLNYIKNIYDTTHKLISRQKFQRNAAAAGSALSKSGGIVKTLFTIVGKSAAVIAGIVLFVMAINIDQSGGNSSMHELIGVILLIASAATQMRRGTSFIEIIIGAGSGVLAFQMAKYLDNGSMLQLGGAVVLIIVAISFFKRLGKKEDK